MGFNNSRTIVLDLDFREYEATGEVLEDWTAIAGSPTLGKYDVTTLHPAHVMEFLGVSASVGATYALQSPLSEPSDYLHDSAFVFFEASAWVQMDAGLAGSQVRISGVGGLSTTYDMPADGSWVEIGHVGQWNSLAVDTRGLSVELVNVVGTGTFRVGRVIVRRLKNHWTSDSLSDGVVLPFMSDSDKLSLSWLTNRIDCWNGAEQRTQHRLVPKGRLTSEFLVQDEEESALLDSLIFGSEDRLFFVPFWPDAIELEDMGTGVLLDIDKMKSRLFHVGGAVMFWRSPFEYSAAIIQADASENVISSGWFAGYGPGDICVPLLSGYLTPTASIALPTPEDRRLTATFDVNLLGGSGNTVLP